MKKTFKIYCASVLILVFSDAKAVSHVEERLESALANEGLKSKKHYIFTSNSLRKRLKKTEKKLPSRNAWKNTTGKKKQPLYSTKSWIKKDREKAVPAVIAQSTFRAHEGRKKGKGNLFLNSTKLPVMSKDREKAVPATIARPVPFSGESGAKKATEQRELGSAKLVSSRGREKAVPTHTTIARPMPFSGESGEKKATEQRELGSAKLVSSRDREKAVPATIARPMPPPGESGVKKATEQRELGSAKYSLPEDPLPKDPTLPNGLVNFGATCYANSAMQLLNAIQQFRKSLIESSSTDSFVSGIRAIFEGLDSPTGIQSDRLKELWKDIFTPMNGAKGAIRFTLGMQGDACEFIETCLEILELKKEQAILCFQFKLCTTIQAKDDPTVKKDSYGREPKKMLILPIAQEPQGQEIEGEFMETFQDFRKQKYIRAGWMSGASMPSKKEVDEIVYRQFVTPPKVLLIKVMRLGYSTFASNRGSLIKIDRPVEIPSEFKLPPDMVTDSKSIKYKLIGGVVHGGTAHGGHYMAYIRDIGDDENLLEFNDSIVQRVPQTKALERLKAGAYMVAYERED
ncbi:MAG: ubiquitin carboxyl-terminal hydrolase [Puniceicoccales bacterium]|nr:ubiquitin carboxyl-terminal hydrolase [Puniceicoccales bacterium]